MRPQKWGLADEKAPDEPCDTDSPTVSRVKATRKKKLAEIIQGEGSSLPWQERSQLHTLLLKHHNSFQLEEGERGETDLVQMQIDTGDASPKSQPSRHIAFAA